MLALTIVNGTANKFTYIGNFIGIVLSNVLYMYRYIHILYITIQVTQITCIVFIYIYIIRQGMSKKSSVNTEFISATPPKEATL